MMNDDETDDETRRHCWPIAHITALTLINYNNIFMIDGRWQVSPPQNGTGRI